MNLEVLKEKLSESEFSELDQYVKNLVGQRDEARRESIEGRKGLKAEVEQLRTLKANLFERLGIEAEEDLEKLPDAKGQAEAQKQYEARIKRLEKELKAATESYTALDSKHRSTLLESTLQRAIAAHEFVDSDLVAEFAKTRIKFEGDEVMYVDGDKQLSLDEGIKLIAQTKPHLLKSQGSSGSGFNPTATTGKLKPFKEMTLTERTELYKKDPQAYQAAQAA